MHLGQKCQQLNRNVISAPIYIGTEYDNNGEDAVQHVFPIAMEYSQKRARSCLYLPCPVPHPGSLSHFATPVSPGSDRATDFGAIPIESILQRFFR